MDTSGPDSVEQLRKINMEGLIAQAGTIRRLNLLMGRKVQDSVFSQIRNGNLMGNGRPRVLGTDLARKMEKRLGLPIGWMDLVHGPEEFAALNLAVAAPRADDGVRLADYVVVPVVTVQEKSGDPVFGATNENPLLVSRKWLPPQTGTLDLSACIWTGDSMLPLVRPGSILLLHTTERARRDIVDRGLYLVRLYGDVRLARVQKNGDGSFVFFYANADYRDTLIPGEKLEGICHFYGHVLQIFSFPS